MFFSCRFWEHEWRICDIKEMAEHCQNINHLSVCRKVFWGCALVIICVSFLYNRENYLTEISLPVNEGAKRLPAPWLSPSHALEGEAQMFIMKPHFANGSLILTKNILQWWNQSLTKWNPRHEILASIHILKTAGTSFDSWLQRKRMWKLDKYPVNKGAPNRKYQSKLGIYGFHFDFSLVSEIQNLGYNIKPITILRHPVRRMISHFYYVKQGNWRTDLKFKRQNLNEYLHDKQSMLITYELWHDGQVSNWCVSLLPTFPLDTSS